MATGHAFPLSCRAAGRNAPDDPAACHRAVRVPRLPGTRAAGASAVRGGPPANAAAALGVALVVSAALLLSACAPRQAAAPASPTVPAAGDPADPYRGAWVCRDFPGVRLTIDPPSVVLTEGTGARQVATTGKITRAERDGLAVSWNVTDPDAITRSLFVPSWKGGGRPAGLREIPSGGLGGTVHPFYVPAAAVVASGSEGDERAPGGAGPAGRAAPAGPAAVFVSASGTRLSVSYDAGAAHATVVLPDGQVCRLPRAVSGSGARYSDGSRTCWEHQGTVTFEIGDRVVFEGRLEE